MAEGGVSSKQLQQVQEIAECPLCHDFFRDPRQVPCLHVYCKNCLQRHINEHVQVGNKHFPCPECRVSFKIPEQGAEGFQKDFRTASLAETFLPKQDHTVSEEPDVPMIKTIGDTVSHLHPDKSLKKPKSPTTECVYVETTRPSSSAKGARLSRPKNKAVLVNKPSASKSYPADHRVQPRSTYYRAAVPPLQLNRMPLEHRPATTKTRAKLPMDIKRTSIKLTLMGKVGLPWFASGLACSPDGQLVICKGSGRAVNVYNSTLSCSNSPRQEQQKLVAQFQTTRGTQAWGITCNEQYIYVSDSKTGSVLEYTFEGELSQSIEVGFKGGAGLSLVESTLYITSSSSNDVYIAQLETDPIQVRKLALAATQICNIDGPWFIAANAGQVAISCKESNQVHVFDTDGLPLYTYGDGDKDVLGETQGVVVDRENRLIIADEMNRRLIFVSSAGQLLDAVTMNEDEIKAPHALALDEQGRLVVTCSETQVAVIYKYALA